ncbi:WAT1-related protein At4g30420-like [Rhodamnia argentea]|uniref:WAT1-related protein n=1 Tax=Rhodamnia argentea TaxID=178133 RepID=A0A8B8PLG0_9MYRT|nr:WAT1-related protein At4g30420-like [Rhodamnia argentea]
MGGFDDYKPVVAMFGLQFTYAALALFARASLLQGLSPRVFVVYRQATATLFISPVAFLWRKSHNTSLGLKSFSWIFLASLIGIAINQIMYLEGMYLTSSSMASASGNLVPATTFLVASTLRMEKINARSLRSIAKILGTVVCVGGAIVMALLRGPKLLNAESHRHSRSIFASEGDGWLQGCVFLVGSACCWSIWLILQVPMSASHPDHLSLSAWMCFMSTIQCAVITLFLEQDPEAWKIHSKLGIAAILYAGIVGSGISYFVQSWCISQRGPLFSAMFNPLCTVIVTILATIFLHEEIYIGSLAGAIGVVAGLYFVLWGKAKDHVEINEETEPILQIDRARTVKPSADGSSLEKPSSCKCDLSEPLLSDISSDETNPV